MSDAQGRWRSESLPHSAGAGEKLELLITHPDRIPMTQPVTGGELRILKPVSVLKAGRKVAGTVNSPTGRPVAGASVVVLFRNGGERYRRVRTDASGQFDTGRFIDPSWDELILSVQAEGFATSLRRLANTPEVPPQDILLSPRKPLRGRVVDANGRAVAGAVVVPSWDDFKGKLTWDAETDADGRFVWFDAPASGTISLDVTKASFRTIQRRPVAAGSDEVVMTLHRPRHLHGTATDATTGRPIERFTLVAGEGPHHPGWAVDWKRGEARVFTDGRYDVAGDDSPERGEPLSLRIEADGYEPAECLGLPGDAEEIARDVRLHQDPRRKASVALAGIVRGPDGRPVAGADVAVADEPFGFRIRDGRLESPARSTAQRVVTGVNGRYAFPPRRPGGWIVAVHDLGFAMRSPEQLAASADVTLSPWGRIEGVLRFGREPAPGQPIEAVLADTPLPGRVDAEVQTDGSGRFVLDRVTPGRLLVCRPVRHEDSGYIPSHRIAVNVEAGRTATVQIGGTGRPVIGRLVLPEGVVLNHFLGGSTRLHTEPLPMPIPPETPRLTDEQWSAWRDALEQDSAVGGVLRGRADVRRRRPSRRLVPDRGRARRALTSSSSPSAAMPAAASRSAGRMPGRAWSSPRCPAAATTNPWISAPSRSRSSRSASRTRATRAGDPGCQHRGPSDRPGGPPGQVRAAGLLGDLASGDEGRHPAPQRDVRGLRPRPAARDDRAEPGRVARPDEALCRAPGYRLAAAERPRLGRGQPDRVGLRRAVSQRGDPDRPRRADHCKRPGGQRDQAGRGPGAGHIPIEPGCQKR